MTEKITKVEITSLELWVLRAAGALIVACLVWVGSSLQATLVAVAEIRKELDITKPADVLEAVHKFEGMAVTREQVQKLIDSTAPWYRERSEWLTWRGTIESFKSSATKEITETRDYIRESSEDRFKKADFLSWLRRFERDNPTLKVPD